ncbi:glycosyltransferase [Salipaludibacillus sp. CF4.18]|uniref:glycosyltransferase n=1 Tax=Salipaludibacillus sp. CF4.18 TaxID=3373081 RepID=UPI003EE67563
MHILHITRFAKWVDEQKCNFDYNKPFILTMGGTDVHVDLAEKGWSETTVNLVNQSTAVVCFSEEARKMVVEVNPDWQGKVKVVPQAVIPPKRTDQGSNKDEKFEILLPAGLRPIKDVLHLLDAWKDLDKQIPFLKVKVIGEALDKDVEREVLAACDYYSFLEYHSTVSFDEMGNVYAEADVVINTSKEEGQSTALCEAMALGIPVIARNNAGNRELIKHGKTGYIYQYPSEFPELINRIRKNPLETKRMTERAQAYFQHERTVEQETTDYLSIFKSLSES